MKRGRGEKQVEILILTLLFAHDDDDDDGVGVGERERERLEHVICVWISSVLVNNNSLFLSWIFTAPHTSILTWCGGFTVLLGEVLPQRHTI